MDRDLPLNKQQRKEGCIFLTIIGILGITSLILLYQVVNN
jgi:hypothetical protein